MNATIRYAALAVAGILLAGCVPTAPEFVTESPAASVEGPAPEAPQTDGFVPDDISDALTSLTAEDGEEWRGGRASQIAGNTQSGSGWAYTDPESCLIFINAPMLTFSDDIESGSQDRIFIADRVTPQNPGPEDDQYMVSVTARVLEEAGRAQTEVFDPVISAAPECNAFVGTTAGLEWPISNTSGLSLHPDITVAGADQSVGVTYAEAEYAFPQQAIVFAQVGNVIFAVTARENELWAADHDLLGEAVSAAQEVVASLTGA